MAVSGVLLHHCGVNRPVYEEGTQMIKKQCPNCRDIVSFVTPTCHRCGLAFVFQPMRTFIQTCLRIAGLGLLFAGLILTTSKYF